MRLGGANSVGRGDGTRVGGREGDRPDRPGCWPTGRDLRYHRGRSPAGARRPATRAEDAHHEEVPPDRRRRRAGRPGRARPGPVARRGFGRDAGDRGGARGEPRGGRPDARRGGPERRVARRRHPPRPRRRAAGGRRLPGRPPPARGPRDPGRRLPPQQRRLRLQGPRGDPVGAGRPDRAVLQRRPPLQQRQRAARRLAQGLLRPLHRGGQIGPPTPPRRPGGSTRRPSTRSTSSTTPPSGPSPTRARTSRPRPAMRAAPGCRSS